MKFAQLLSSQLTPEWRQYYIDYEGLKKCIYVMTDSRGLMFQEHESKSCLIKVAHNCVGGEV